MQFSAVENYRQNVRDVYKHSSNYRCAKMAASPEKLGLKLLRALKREKDGGKTLLNCSPLSAIAAELRSSEAEFQKAFRFLAEKQSIVAADRPDGKAALPSEKGEAMLAAKKRNSS